MNIGDYVVVNNQDSDSGIENLNGKYGEIIEILEPDVYQYNIKVKFIYKNGEDIECNFNSNEITKVDTLQDNNFDELEEIPEDKGEISDGYHTFNELYYHRMMLFAVICNTYKERAWKSDKHADGSMYDGYFICGINTPEGAYTYHHKLEYWDMFKVTTLQNAPEWDGHTPEDITRLLSLLETLGNNQ